jgi:hypothetical protein
MPAPVRRLIDQALIRVLAGPLGVQSIRRHDMDVVFRTSDPARLEGVLTGLPGKVRLVGQSLGSASVAGSEVWWRPTAAACEPDTLLPLLGHRLSQ